MDLLIAADSVPLSQATSAPTTGTPQYAWDGAAPLQPGTIIPSYILNDILEELVVGLIAGSGLTPDRTNKAQVIAAVRALIAVEAATRTAADAVTLSSAETYTNTYAALIANFYFSSSGVAQFPTPEGTFQMQFGGISAPGDSTQHSYSFPTAFNTACLAVYISYQAAVPPVAGNIGANPSTTNNRTVFTATNTASGPPNNGCTFIALGY